MRPRELRFRGTVVPPELMHERAPDGEGSDCTSSGGARDALRWLSRRFSAMRLLQKNPARRQDYTSAGLPAAAT